MVTPVSHIPSDSLVQPQASGLLGFMYEESENAAVKRFVAAILYQLAVIGGSFAMYYEYGLTEATIFALAALAAQLIVMRACQRDIPPIFYVQFFLLGAFFIPGMIFNDHYYYQLQEFVSGTLLGLGMLTWAIYHDYRHRNGQEAKPLVQSLIPNSVYGALNTLGNKAQHYGLEKTRDTYRLLEDVLRKTPTDVWVKIDYLWAAELLLSAAISFCVANFGTEDQWFIGKYTIGPALTCVAFGTGFYMMYSAANGKDTSSKPGLSKML